MSQTSPVSESEPVAYQFRQRSAVGKGQQCSLPWCDWVCIEREDYERYVREPNKLVQVRPLYADHAQRQQEPIALINRRLEDLAEANAIYGKDQRLNAPDKIARNDREISWLKDLRSTLSLADTSTAQPQADWNYTPKPGQLSGPSTKD